MTKKIFKSIFFTSIITVVVCLILMIGVLQPYFFNQIKKELANEASFVAAGVENVGIQYFNDFNSNSNSRITWISADGTVIYDTAESADSMENHSDREEFKKALETGVGESERYSTTLAQKTMYYAKRLNDGTVIRVSSERYTAFVLVLDMIRPIVFVVAVMLALSIMLSNAMARNIVKPINEIDLEKPDIDESYEEIFPLLQKISRQNKTIARQMRNLREKQNEFNTITQNMCEGFLLIDKKTELLSYNSAALDMLGADASNVEVNRSVYYINRSESFRTAVEKALSGKSNEKKFTLNGRIYNILANPVFSDKESGKMVDGAVLVILDITEKELRDEMRHEFTSNVSHELKTPLTSIYGISEMLMSGMVKPEDVERFAGDIYAESGRMISLINDIIKLSQLDENSIVEQKEPVDLYDSAAIVIERLSVSAQKRGIAINLEGEHALINGVPSMISEIIYNLCDNAVKYNKENGSVTVTIINDAKHPKLIVEDTGIGIPSEHLNRVFERFYRVDKSHSRKIGGTGLGLSIVKHSVMYHNGNINIESKPDVGTKITIIF